MNIASVGLAAALMLIDSPVAISQGDPCQSNALPNPLPLNGEATTSTCAPDVNPVCSTVSYPYPRSSTKLILNEPGTVTFALQGWNVPPFTPALYVSDGPCDVEDCGSVLPAGEYCVTVTADPTSALGTCGCFTLQVITTTDALFRDGFEFPKSDPAASA